jgi:hypothetical protein
MKVSSGGGDPTPIFDCENRRTNEVNYDEVAFRKIVHGAVFSSGIAL